MSRSTPFCRRCGKLHEPTWTYAVARFDAEGPAGYRTCKRCERMELVTVDSFATEAADE